jgi:hypothetical protein
MTVVSRLSSLFANSSPNVPIGNPDSQAGLPSRWASPHRSSASLPAFVTRQSMPGAFGWATGPCSVG